MASRKLGQEASSLREVLKKGTILVAGDSDGYINVAYGQEPVHVSIVFDVQGYGPHIAAIYANQGKRRGSLEAAFDILEERQRERLKKYLVQKRHLRTALDDTEEDDEWERLTENFDGREWTIPSHEFGEVIRGTDAEKFITVFKEGAEIDARRARELGEVLSDVLQEKFGLITKGHSTEYQGYVIDVKKKGLGYDYRVAKIRVLDDKRIVAEEEEDPGTVKKLVREAGLGNAIEVLDEWHPEDD